MRRLNAQPKNGANKTVLSEKSWVSEHWDQPHGKHSGCLHSVQVEGGNMEQNKGGKIMQSI